MKLDDECEGGHLGRGEGQIFEFEYILGYIHTMSHWMK
jgi:hypothetical protein